MNLVLPLLFSAVAIGLLTDRTTPRVRAVLFVVIALVIARAFLKG